MQGSILFLEDVILGGGSSASTAWKKDSAAVRGALAKKAGEPVKLPLIPSSPRKNVHAGAVLELPRLETVHSESPSRHRSPRKPPGPSSKSIALPGTPTVFGDQLLELPRLEAARPMISDLPSQGRSPRRPPRAPSSKGTPEPAVGAAVWSPAEDASVWSRPRSKSAASDQDSSEVKTAPRSRQCRSRWAALRNVAITDQTLAEVKLSRDAKSGNLFGRGDELEREIAMWDVKQVEAAQQRLSAAKQAGVAHRARARDHRERRSKALRDQRRDYLLAMRRIPSWRSERRSSDLHDDALLRLSPDEDEASRPASPRRPASSCSFDPEETHQKVEQRRRLRTLRSLKFQSPRKERLRHLDRAVKARVRELQHLARRETEFEALPGKEREQLRRAFERAALGDASGQPDSPAKLVDGLEELGLRGSTEKERAVIQDLCVEFFLQEELSLHAFAVDLVPRARDVIRNVRQGALLKQFFVFDKDGNGRFGKKECVEFLTRLYRDSLDERTFCSLRDRFVGLYDFLKAASATDLDLKNFQALMGQAEEWRESMCTECEEGIVSKYKLGKRDLECAGDELLVLHESFEQHDHDGSGTLDEMEVVGSLLESGLMPRSGQRKARVGWLIHHAVKECGDEGMGFRSFLKLIRAVRQVCQREVQDELWEVVRRPGHDDEAETVDITVPQACRILCDIGYSPRTQQEQDAIKKLIDKVDLTPAGKLDFRAFQTLVQRVAEKLRAGQRWRENELGRTLGFGPQEMAELRASFFSLDEDGSGRLSLDEFKTKMKIAGLPVDVDEIESMFAALDIDHSGSLNFIEYLYFARYLDDPEFDFKAAIAEARPLQWQPGSHVG